MAATTSTPAHQNRPQHNAAHRQRHRQRRKTPGTAQNDPFALGLNPLLDSIFAMPADTVEEAPPH